MVNKREHRFLLRERRRDFVSANRFISGRCGRSWKTKHLFWNIHWQSCSLNIFLKIIYIWWLWCKRKEWLQCMGKIEFQPRVWERRQKEFRRDRSSERTRYKWRWADVQKLSNIIFVVLWSKTREQRKNKRPNPATGKHHGQTCWCPSKRITTHNLFNIRKQNENSNTGTKREHVGDRKRWRDWYIYTECYTTSTKYYGYKTLKIDLHYKLDEKKNYKMNWQRKEKSL